jgi:hypothetical protein
LAIVIVCPKGQTITMAKVKRTDNNNGHKKMTDNNNGHKKKDRQ